MAAYIGQLPGNHTRPASREACRRAAVTPQPSHIAGRGVPAMILLMGVGLYLSVGTRFVQLRKFGPAMKATLGRIFKHDKAGKGALTPFQAVCTALAATVGTGNIAGVAGAIAIGGPGAVFWMWVSALLGMCTKFAEVTLAVHFRERNQHGDYVGGPMYYIQNGLGRKWRWLAYALCPAGRAGLLRHRQHHPDQHHHRGGGLRADQLQPDRRDGAPHLPVDLRRADGPGFC